MNMAHVCISTYARSAEQCDGYIRVPSQKKNRKSVLLRRTWSQKRSGRRIVMDNSGHNLKTSPATYAQKTPPPPAPALFYKDRLGREWQYWPLIEAEQMWRQARCNQCYCERPAMFVGVVDIFCDGTEYFDGAAAWCYWCMPSEALTPEARRMRQHAEWARRATAQECLEIVKQAWYSADWPSEFDTVLCRVKASIANVATSRETLMADPTVEPDIYAGRDNKAIWWYAERPSDAVNGLPPEAGRRPLTGSSLIKFHV
jgi:hypothetical protein